MTDLHKLVGVALLGTIVAFLAWGVFVNSKQPREKQFGAWINRGSRFQKALKGFAYLSAFILTYLFGLDFGFGVHFLGANYHRPWTYIPGIIFVVFVGVFSNLATHFYLRRGYSAVDDDWLLWNQPSDEEAQTTH